MPLAGPVRPQPGTRLPPAPVDAAALLVDATGKVRGRGDLVFYNHPEHAGSGAVGQGYAAAGDRGTTGPDRGFRPADAPEGRFATGTPRSGSAVCPC
ncbi:TerD family protein [Streptomyces sp. NPDC048337]|uniref:TerD family protein n=1 Tax=Streptomyces sp. NPDC048337 TaxID=3365535 RepID=UPI0037191756